MKYSPIFLLLFVILSACEEVVELDLKDAEPQLVVDATLTDMPLQSQVRLTRSASYDAAGAYASVSGAEVRLRDDLGQDWTLTETAPGIYTLPDLIGEVGRTYALTVQSEAVTATGLSQLLPPVALDSLTFTPVNIQGPGRNEAGFLMRAYLPDTTGETLYLRFMVEVNGEMDRGIYLYNGGLVADNEGMTPFPNLSLAAGDAVRVTAMRLDRAAYTYFDQLADVAGQVMPGAGSAAPTNPESPLSGGVLGYFAAMSVTRIAAVVE